MPTFTRSPSISVVRRPARSPAWRGHAAWPGLRAASSGGRRPLGSVSAPWSRVRPGRATCGRWPAPNRPRFRARVCEVAQVFAAASPGGAFLASISNRFRSTWIDEQGRPLHAASAMDVAHDGIRHVDHLPAAPAHPPGEIHVLIVHEEVVVEEPHVVQHRLSEAGERRRSPANTSSWRSYWPGRPPGTPRCRAPVCPCPVPSRPEG